MSSDQDQHKHFNNISVNDDRGVILDDDDDERGRVRVKFRSMENKRLMSLSRRTPARQLPTNHGLQASRKKENVKKFLKISGIGFLGWEKAKQLLVKVTARHLSTTNAWERHKERMK